MKPSTAELKLFFEQLHHSETQEVIPKKSAILSVVEGHSIRYMPKTVLLDMPPPLPTLYSSTRFELDLPKLLEEAARIFEELHLTPQQMGNEDTARESYLKAMRDLHVNFARWCGDLRLP
ncbi:hypothetical protein DPEC_G00378700 [Dallia pectoralis]|nr:hypothetical protein DPEC_G00378700 [Dallia pectoralis]